MIRGTGPPPPLGDHPNGIDTSHPSYAIDSINWHEPPKQFPESFNNSESANLRLKNDAAYKAVGNPTTWNRYILFGYHAYDHCFQFDTQWELMIQNENDTLQFIWESYSYLIDRGMNIPPKLERWAIDIAKPHLLQHLPSTLNVDTTDPRLARRKYDEHDLMDVDDAEQQIGRTKHQGKHLEWTEVHSKSKARLSKEALDTPIPASPPRNLNTTETNPAEITPPPVPPTTNPSPLAPQSPKNGLTFVHLNDGTLRVTVRWKPENYHELTEDDMKWNLAATDTIHYILATVSDAVLFPWKNGTATTNIPSLDLNPDNLLQYIAPKVTPIESLQMYVFSFRLCLSTSPGRWINHPVTKRNFEKHHVEVNLSNSSSDSGDLLPTVGYIFFKHPKFTQRVYYLSHLRRHLPAHTPFFDIGYHRKTPTGQDIPHLTIRCGENHVGALTEILSTYLDGTNNAVFLGRLLLSKMSTAEVDAIFQTHADYMAKTRVLTMAPTIQNVDLIRKEYWATGIIERSTREWATTLLDKLGNSLQCDAENGGDTRRAQLLVPLENMVQAQQAFKEYKERISTFNQREAEFTTLIQDASPPQAIYVPTPAVHNNLALIQKRSTFSVWEDAPDTIRRPESFPASYGYRPPTMSQTPSQAASTRHPPKVPPHTQTIHNQQPPTKDSTHTKAVTQEDFDLAGDETATTHSQMTKSLATTQNRFAELEAAIRRQQTSVLQHKEELALINTRALTTISLVEAVSKNVLTLTEDTTKQMTALRDELRREAELQAQAQRDNFSQMTDMIARLTARLLPLPIPGFQQHSDISVGATQSDDSEEHDDEEFSDTMSTQTVETDNQSSVAAASPAHKKNKRKSRDSGGTDSARQNLKPPSPPSDQDKRAQYNSNSTPDAGET